MSDTAVAAALRLAGQHPADFGFTLLERHKLRGPDILLKYHLLGFFDNDARRAAHKKAEAWLDEHKDDTLRPPQAPPADNWEARRHPVAPSDESPAAKALRLALVELKKPYGLADEELLKCIRPPLPAERCKARPASCPT